MDVTRWVPIVLVTLGVGVLQRPTLESTRAPTSAALPHEVLPDTALPDTAVSQADVTAAIARAVPLMQNSADMWLEKRSCSSCHHQGLGTVAMAVMNEQGFAVDTARLRSQAQRTMRPSANWQEKFIVNEVSINEAIGQNYRAIGVAAAGHPNTAVTQAVAFLIAGRQHASGRWLSNSRRPPLEDSEVTATALSIRTLSLYPIDARRTEFASRIAAGRTWLAQVKPVSTEERVMQLLGLAWAGAERKTLAPYAQALLAEQRDDGGWAQVATRASDAYATGSALVALQQGAQIRGRDPRLQRGYAFLLSTQHADGSWRVPTTRTRQPGLPYFETGYPHGKDSSFRTLAPPGRRWR